MLQYALIHLFGYKVTIDDLKNFRVGAPCASILQLTRSMTD
jgi:transketolase